MLRQIKESLFEKGRSLFLQKKKNINKSQQPNYCGDFLIHKTVGFGQQAVSCTTKDVFTLVWVSLNKEEMRVQLRSRSRLSGQLLLQQLWIETNRTWQLWRFYKQNYDVLNVRCFTDQYLLSMCRA